MEGSVNTTAKGRKKMAAEKAHRAKRPLTGAGRITVSPDKKCNPSWEAAMKTQGCIIINDPAFLL